MSKNIFESIFLLVHPFALDLWSFSSLRPFGGGSNPVVRPPYSNIINWIWKKKNPILYSESWVCFYLTLHLETPGHIHDVIATWRTGLGCKYYRCLNFETKKKAASSLPEDSKEKAMAALRLRVLKSFDAVVAYGERYCWRLWWGRQAFWAVCPTIWPLGQKMDTTNMFIVFNHFHTGY